MKKSYIQPATLVVALSTQSVIALSNPTKSNTAFTEGSDVGHSAYRPWGQDEDED